ncbi:MAG: hypothetical protein KatS3mg031_0018 [Chitinophagales bacterium]|nr:MAG: hypothetical protein KatS3mg031_0018 [Chitinophagales bacterium]
MKPRVLSAILFLCNPMLAQITLNSGDMPLVGDTIRTATDTLTPGLTVGNAGTNQIWDFSSATPDRINITYVQHPSSTPYASNFPNANRALTQNFSTYVMSRVSVQRYEILGLTGDFLGIGVPLVVQLNPTNEVYRFPVQYGNNRSGTYGFTQTTLYADLPPNIQQQIQSQLPQGVTLESLVTNYRVNYTDSIDGWGKTITPVCTYNALRQKRVEVISLDVDANVRIFGFPNVIPNIIDTTFTTITYNWLAKETKLPVVTTTLSNGNVNSITYSLIPPILDANFTATAASACVGNPVNFQDISSGCPDSWQWSFPGATPSSSTEQHPTGIIYNAPGTYAVSLTVTRGSESNTETKTAYITIHALPTAEATGDTVCAGSSATLIASGGASYLWSTGAVGPTLITTPVADSVYSVTVTSTQGCTATTSAMVKVLPLPAADAGPNDTICPGEVATLTASGGVAYQWNTGSTSATLAITTGFTTSYTVTVTDANGCSASDQATVVVKPAPAADAGPNDTICLHEPAILQASGGTAYLWNTGDTTAQITVRPTATTTYSVHVYGPNGCSSLDIVTVVVKPLPAKNLNDLTICFGSSAVLDAGNPGAAYLWNTGATSRTITVNVSGTYAVTVTGTNGCSSSDTAVVSISSSLTVNPGNHTFCDGDSVTLDAGNPGASYLWSTGDTSRFLTVFSAGLYHVTVTDAIGCTGQGSSQITVYSLPTVDAGDNDTICLGETATLQGSGNASLLWSTQDTQPLIQVSPTTTTVYYLSATDTHGCTNTDSVWVIVNPLPVVDAGPNDTICPGEQGMLTATGNGSYQWSTGDTTAAIIQTPVVTTSYTVIVTNTFGCTSSDQATIVVHPLPIANAGPDKAICENEPVWLIASGGNTYQWNTGDTTDTLFFLADTSRIYVVTVTNNYSCQSRDSVWITVFPLPQVAFGALDSAYCPNSPPVLLTAMPAGGIFSGNGVIGNLFHPQSTPAGNFDLVYTFTDSNSCTASDTQTVSVLPETLTFISGLNVSYCEDAPADTFSVFPAGGILSGPGVTGNIFNPAAAGPGGPYAIVYSYTDSFSCTYRDTVRVTIHPLPVLSITGLDSTYCVDDPAVVVTVSPPGGTLSGNGISGNMFDPAAAGPGTHAITYSYTNNGCSNLEKTRVTVQVCTPTGKPSIPGQIHIYPNPAHHQLHISQPNGSALFIQLIGQDGKLLIEKATFDSRVLLDIGNLSEGLYFLKVYSGKTVIIRKIVIQHP